MPLVVQAEGCHRATSLAQIADALALGTAAEEPPAHTASPHAEPEKVLGGGRGQGLHRLGGR